MSLFFLLDASASGMYDKSDRGRNSAEQSEHTVSQSSLIALQIGHVFMKLDTPHVSHSLASLLQKKMHCVMLHIHNK